MLMYVAFKIGNVAEKTQNESYQDTVYDLMISFILLNIFRKWIQKGIQTNEAKYVCNKKASFKKNLLALVYILPRCVFKGKSVLCIPSRFYF